jgi:hypothetical protein
LLSLASPTYLCLNSGCAEQRLPHCSRGVAFKSLSWGPLVLCSATRPRATVYREYTSTFLMLESVRNWQTSNSDERRPHRLIVWGASTSPWPIRPAAVGSAPPWTSACPTGNLAPRRSRWRTSSNCCEVSTSLGAIVMFGLCAIAIITFTTLIRQRMQTLLLSYRN